MSISKDYKNRLASKLTEEEVKRHGGFTRKRVKVLIGQSHVESLTMLDGDKERRRDKKDGTSNIDERGLFVTTRKDICTNIKQPKKKVSTFQRKKENAENKNNNDAVIAERMQLNPLYEEYCKTKGYIPFGKFEKIHNRKNQRRK